MSTLILRNRLDRVVDKLCMVRNEVVSNYDVDFQIEDTLSKVEQSIEALAQEVDEEVSDL